jgi:hypothetical protein
MSTETADANVNESLSNVASNFIHDIIDADIEAGFGFTGACSCGKREFCGGSGSLAAGQARKTSADTGRDSRGVPAIDAPGARVGGYASAYDEPGILRKFVAAGENTASAV